MNLYPGTLVEKTNLSGEQFLQGIFMATNGLVMRQINEITGVATPAIQNWVSRGFISRPEQKRYSKDTTARIFIINELRATMSLENIKKLLVYVNGRVNDSSDNIISESLLYAYFCKIIFDKRFAFNCVNELIDEVIADYNEKISGAKLRLKTALEVICINYLAGKLTKRSNDLLHGISQQNIFGEIL